MPPQLVLHSLYASFLFDEVVDDFGRLFVFQLSLGDAAHVKEVLQFRVKVIQIKTCVWIPAHVADVLEVAGCADVRFGQLLLLAFGFLVLPAQAAVAEHVVEVVRLLVAVRVVEADIVYLWILDVHCGHRQRWTISRVTPFLRFALSAVQQVIDGGSKSLCLFFTGKVQTDLTGISCK